MEAASSWDYVVKTVEIEVLSSLIHRMEDRTGVRGTTTWAVLQYYL